MAKYARVYLKGEAGRFMDFGPCPPEWKFTLFMHQVKMDGCVLNESMFIAYDQIKFAILIETDAPAQVLPFPRPVA